MKLISGLIGQNGEDVEKVRSALGHIQNYHGVSGNFSIDANHDGSREYQLKEIQADGSVTPIKGQS